MEGFIPYKKEDIDKFVESGCWLNLTLGDLLDRAVELYPQKEALVDSVLRLTYSELRTNVERLAKRLLKIGIHKGDFVLLQLPNWHEFVYSFFALQKIGAVIVLLVPQNGTIEIKHFSDLTGAKAWILPEKYRKINYLPMIDEVFKSNSTLKNVILVRSQEESRFMSIEQIFASFDVDKNDAMDLSEQKPAPTDLALILPTGGTTGLPKAAPRTHNDYICNVKYYSKALEQNVDDVCLVVGPVGHNQGLINGIMGTIFSFGKIVLLDSTRPEDFCKAVQDEKVTYSPLVPTLALRLANFEDLRKYDLTSLGKITVGGAHSASQLVNDVREKIGCIYVNSFGMVEGPLCRTRLDDSQEVIATTVGRPVCPYDEFRVIDEDDNEVPPNTEGELAVKGPGVFTGYFKSDNKGIFDKNGFFKTGDLAIIDEFRNIHITGRKKEIIKRGGENIGAVQIEELIMKHPDVEEVAVIGMPDKDLGERVCAYVKPIKGKLIEPANIVTFLQNRGTSKLLIPERFEFVRNIPLSKVGKPDKKALLEDITERLQSEQSSKI